MRPFISSLRTWIDCRGLTPWWQFAEGGRHEAQPLALVVTLALGVPAAPLSTEAQKAGKVPRVGMLIPVSLRDAATNAEAFRRGLRELDYVEGQNIAIEYRYSALRP